MRDSLQQIADADQTRMGLVAYLMTSDLPYLGRYLLLQVRDSLQQIADADQTRMGLVAYLMTSDLSYCEIFVVTGTRQSTTDSRR